MQNRKGGAVSSFFVSLGADMGPDQAQAANQSFESFSIRRDRTALIIERGATKDTTILFYGSENQAASNLERIYAAVLDAASGSRPQAIAVGSTSGISSAPPDPFIMSTLLEIARHTLTFIKPICAREPVSGITLYEELEAIIREAETGGAKEPDPVSVNIRREKPPSP